jgi:PAS domain S-box-containing protein
MDGEFIYENMKLRITELEKEVERLKILDAEFLCKSEQQFAIIFHSSPAAIALTRIADNRIVEINRAWEEKTGISREEAVGRTTFELGIWVNPEIRALFIHELNQKGKLREVEAVIKTRSGNLSHMVMSGQYITFNGEECLLTMAQDITAAKRMEEELTAASRYNRNLIEISLDPLVTINVHGKIMDVNKATEQITGVSREDLIGSDFSNYFTEPEKARRGYKQAFSKGTVKDYPLSIRHRAGHVTDVLYNASVYKNEAGEVLGIFAAARDITELKKSEVERDRLQAELFQSQKMESLGTLVAGVAHEINNPINIIMNNAPLLQRIWKDVQPVMERHAKSNPKNKYGGLTYDFIRDNLGQLLSDVEISANRVAAIASGLKDFSRKTISSEKENVSINVAVENAVRLAASSLNKSGITLEIEMDPDLPAVKANLQNLEQIVLNLVVNAIQAIHHDHGEIRITTNYNNDDELVFLSIEDNGKGIDPSIADRIFDPFFTEKQKNGGTGLGLSITHNLVAANNGKISFRARKGEGTIFNVFFPAGLRFKTTRILIADDDKAIVKVIERVLKHEKRYIIDRAYNGNEALIKTGIFEPDLLLLDIFMPEMDGVEVIRAIKNQPELDKMKIIVISGYTNHKKITRALEMGVYKFLPKPINAKELLEAVEEAVKE